MWIWPSWVYVSEYLDLPSFIQRFTISNCLVFIIPCAVAKNIETMLICRFFAGFFASAPLTLAGGAISDIWDNEERGFAIALFAAAPYGGPVMGPIVGGFVGETVGWRWIYWVQMIFAGVMALFKCTIPETFPPVILKRRAQKLRKETGDMNIATEQELFKVPLSQLLVETLIRPFEMLVTEPILLLLSLYIALIYGLLVRISAVLYTLNKLIMCSLVRLLLQLPGRLRWQLPMERGHRRSDVHFRLDRFGPRVVRHAAVGEELP